VHVSAPGADIVALNSFRAADDLLNKRSMIYSDRCVWVSLTTRRLTNEHTRAQPTNHRLNGLVRSSSSRL